MGEGTRLIWRVKGRAFEVGDAKGDERDAWFHTARVYSPAMKRLAALVVCVSLAAACGGSGASSTPTQPTAAPPALSGVASEYLTRILDLMQANSVKRPGINWTSFRSAVVAEAGAAQSIADLHPAIRRAITLLGDGHSAYRGASGDLIYIATRTCVASNASQPELPPTIGYVKVTTFSGGGTEATNYANQIQAAIAAADRDDLIGWMVDLRGNRGGNMWPMIAGLGPVLGTGPLGYFTSPTGSEVQWDYRNGSAISGTSTQTRVTTPYRLRRPDPRVAVMTDNAVASSGEATLVSFRQRPNTRTFGEASCGLSTSNTNYTLSDGATLILTTATFADRSKVLYGDMIAPDETFTDHAQAAQRAIAWLQTGR